MFGWLNRQKTAETERLIEQALSPQVITIVSASCCMPGAQALDAPLRQAAAQALAQARLDWPVVFVTVTQAQGALGRVSGRLTPKAVAATAQISELFATRGLQAFPLLLVDQQVVAHGGVPPVSLIVQHLPIRQATA